MCNESRYLYRGVSVELYEKTKGKLIPKSLEPFTYTFKFGEPGFNFNSGATFDSSPENAVLKHQYNQQGFPTSGVSTTPILEQAKYYATSGGKDVPGYIYKIDRNLLDKYGVTEYFVDKIVTNPSVPEDKEVILVSRDNGMLPEEIIVEVIYIDARGCLSGL
jgi:hypothetical protein